MDSETRTAIRQALDTLKPYLAAYVGQRLARTNGASERADVQALLSAMIGNWDEVFARELPTTVRHYVFELKDVRNRWAHEEEFSTDDAHRAVDTARMVAKAIGAPTTALESLTARPVAERPRAVPARAALPVQARTNARHAAPERHVAMPSRRGADGVILNAAALTAADVALQRVLCPACEDKVFVSWPEGWDAHAAHACSGVGGATVAERKTAFRTRFAHLFRDAGVSGRPAKQRDVMRTLVRRYGSDEERVIHEYAAAERRGEVTRAHNTYGLTSEDYARRLLADGQAKGWL
ncbi:MAG TPA: Swt1 family HEPN domain-containing protein [Candidatus Elarobacter sp.]|nr:Swt1 family HEPN domain-containing protein [Candidatus Elarobacter sp.]